MDYKYIEQLLERYWKCETSLEEEAILRSFFAQKDVPVSLLPYRDLFCQEQKMGEDHLGSDFDERIVAMVGQEEPRTPKVRTITLSSRLRPLFKAAASLAILLTFSMAIQQAMDQNAPSQPTDIPHTEVATGAETAHTDPSSEIDTTKTAITSDCRQVEILEEQANN